MECGRVVFTGHAVRRMFERGITEREVELVLEAGTGIADYPDDEPLPSLLLLGFPGGRAIHVLVARDAEGGCYVVTAYIPIPSRWLADSRTRR